MLRFEKQILDRFICSAELKKVFLEGNDTLYEISGTV